MDWNLSAGAKSYQEWYCTPEGAFALQQEQAVIEQLILHWPRRNHSLLEVGCGPGVFLEKFWEAGLDVSGLDASDAMLDLARQRMGNRAELQLGVAEHLPFDDNSFDYVALINTLEFVTHPKNVIREACRVAAKGLLIGFLNTWSLRHVGRERGNADKAGGSAGKKQLYSFNFLQIYSMLRKMNCYQQLGMRSTLLGPQSSWGRKGLWQKINALILPMPLGAFTAIRVDLCPQPGMHPLWMKRTVNSMEYSGRPSQTAGMTSIKIPQ